MEAQQGKVKIQRIRGLRLFGVWFLSLFARMYYATIRLRISDEDRRAIGWHEVPLVIAFWHNRILIMPIIRWRLRNRRHIRATISASRDGAWITAFVDQLGIGACRGSSSKRGAGVAMELLQTLKDGEDVAFTPDGPRGPIYTFHNGTAAVAKMAKCPVLLMCPNVRAGHRFNSWDGFYLPRPFSRIDVRARLFQPDQLPQDRDACVEFLRKAMIEMSEDLPEPPRCRGKKA